MAGAFRPCNHSGANFTKAICSYTSFSPHSMSARVLPWPEIVRAFMSSVRLFTSMTCGSLV